MRFEKLTVGQYQELYKIHTSSDDDIDKAVASIACITGKPRWEVEAMDLDKFREKSSEIAVLFSPLLEQAKPVSKLKINGKKYRICLNPRKLTAGQYIDLQHFLKDGQIIRDLHKLMACLVTPYSFWKKGKYDGENHNVVAEGLIECNFSQVHATCVFFLNLWNYSIKAITPYLSKEILKKVKSPVMREMDLQKFMDGFTMQSPYQNSRELI